MPDARMRTLLRPAAVAFTVGLAMIGGGCSDTPTQANAPLTPLPILGNVVFHDTTIRALGSRTFQQYIPMNGQYNLVGSYGNYKAYTMIEFYSSSFPARDSVTVTSATLQLHSSTRFGDSTASFGFTMYRITQSWDEATATWDTVALGTFSDRSVAYGTYTGTVGPDSQTITVNLDTVLARLWLRTYTDTTTTKYGLLLIPTPGTSMVRGLYSFGADSVYLRPMVTITSTVGGETNIDSSNTGIDSFVGDAGNVATDPQLLYLQSGVAWRSTMLFDVSFIPRGAFVNSAELRMVSSPAAERLNRYAVDSVQAHVLLSTTDMTQYEYYTYTYGSQKGTPNVYTFDARHLVQAWVRGPNDGVLLTSDQIGETSSFDLHAFYNETADSTRRPQLRILYSVSKQ